MVQLVPAYPALSWVASPASLVNFASLALLDIHAYTLLHWLFFI